MTALMNTYGTPAEGFSHGKGAYLYDNNDNRFLDAISGIGVNALGHSHPAVSQAIKDQADKLIHTSNLYGIEKQQLLAEALHRVSGMDNVFFGNSGAEANEAAIKIARLYGHQNGIESPNIVVMESAFHGRTMATLSASGNSKIQTGFGPLVSGFVRVPYGDIAALEAVASNNQDVVAVLMEPLQGEAGVNVPPQGFLKAVRSLCDNNNWLMMLDEVQTGNGRTGAYFAYQHEGILPDVVATAKGLGNGVPIGACLAHGKAASVFGPGNHGSTFGGNPLCSAAALAVVETIEADKLCNNAAAMGDYMLAAFKEQLADTNMIADIRGKGLMIGIEIKQPCVELVNDIRELGVLINVASGNVVRMLPPLIIDQQQADTIVAAVTTAIKAFAQPS